MFDVDGFVAECQTARAESPSMLAVQEVLNRALAKPDEVATALRAERGAAVLHRGDDLTILSIVVPSKSRQSLPHDHRMWAVVGVYEGREDNQFFRRSNRGLVESGRRSVGVSETLAMGDDTIHAVRNPLEHGALAALHVYGGDLIGADRSMWTSLTGDEEPYDDTRMMGPGGFKDSRS